MPHDNRSAPRRSRDRLRQASVRQQQGDTTHLNRIYGDDDRDNPLIGLEFEMEGDQTFPKGNSPFWLNHYDGSLRGHSIEYVTKYGLQASDAEEALADLSDLLDDSPVDISPNSTRTSTHVHLNAKCLSKAEIVSFACLWYILEEAFADALQPSRQGNLFALRGVDMGVGDLANMLSPGLASPSNGLVSSVPHDYRYAAFNWASMRKHVTIELRLLPGFVDPNDAFPHLQRYLEIYKLVTEVFRTPDMIIKTFSSTGPNEFVERYLPTNYAYLTSVFPDPDTTYRYFWRGMRLAQDLAYIIPTWGEPQEVPTYEDFDVVQPAEQVGEGPETGTWDIENATDGITYAEVAQVDLELGQLFAYTTTRVVSGNHDIPPNPQPTDGRIPGSEQD